MAKQDNNYADITYYTANDSFGVSIQRHNRDPLRVGIYPTLQEAVEARRTAGKSQREAIHE